MMIRSGGIRVLAVAAFAALLALVLMTLKEADNTGAAVAGTPTSGSVEMIELPTEEYGYAKVAVYEDVTYWLIAGKQPKLVEQDQTSGTLTQRELSIPTQSPSTTFILAGPSGVFIVSHDVFGEFDTSDGNFRQFQVPKQTRIGSDAVEEIATGSPLSDQPFVDAVMSPDGAVWLARDFTHSLLRYESETGRFAVEGVPDAIEVPGYLRATTGELLIGEYRRPSTPGGEREGYSIRDLDGGAWRRVTTKGLRMAMSDGKRFVFGDTKSGGMAALDRGALSASGLGSDSGLRATDILAVGPDESVWFVYDGYDIARRDGRTGGVTIYELPRMERPDGPVAPNFTGVSLDENGDLWFTYSGIGIHTGCASAPQS